MKRLAVCTLRGQLIHPIDGSWGHGLNCVSSAFICWNPTCQDLGMELCLEIKAAQR